MHWQHKKVSSIHRKAIVLAPKRKMPPAFVIYAGKPKDGV
jgi:hypothetical protein